LGFGSTAVMVSTDLITTGVSTCFYWTTSSGFSATTGLLSTTTAGFFSTTYLTGFSTTCLVTTGFLTYYFEGTTTPLFKASSLTRLASNSYSCLAFRILSLRSLSSSSSFYFSIINFFF
jgi:hypothetical protein